MTRMSPQGWNRNAKNLRISLESIPSSIAKSMRHSTKSTESGLDPPENQFLGVHFLLCWADQVDPIQFRPSGKKPLRARFIRSTLGSNTSGLVFGRPSRSDRASTFQEKTALSCDLPDRPEMPNVPNHRKNRSKIDPQRDPGTLKIDSKSLPGPFGTLCGVQECLEIVSGVSRDVPGTPLEHPESPKARPGMPERAPGSALTQPKSTPNRARDRINRVSQARLARELF